MSRLARTLARSSLVLAVVLASAAAASAHSAEPAEGLGRTAVVLKPKVYDDLTAGGVEVTPLGRATLVPFRDTVKIKLPITAITETEIEHGGGIGFGSESADLSLRRLVIPESGIVTGHLRGSQIGDRGRANLFFQAESGSTLGDASLRFTYSFALYVNSTFDTDFAELEVFGFFTTRRR